MFIFGLAFIMIGCNLEGGEYEARWGGLFTSCGEHYYVRGVFMMHSHPDCDEPFEVMVDATIERLEEMFRSQGFRSGRIKRDGDRYIQIHLPDINDPVAVLRNLGNAAQVEFIFRGETIIVGSDIVSAFASIQPPNDHVVSLTFNERGAAAFAHATQNIGETIEVWIVSGQGEYRVENLLTAPTIQAHITAGNVVIAGMGSQERANEFATQINAGRLPLLLELVCRYCCY